MITDVVENSPASFRNYKIEYLTIPKFRVALIFTQRCAKIKTAKIKTDKIKTAKIKTAKIKTAKIKTARNLGIVRYVNNILAARNILILFNVFCDENGCIFYPRTRILGRDTTQHTFNI